MKATTFSPLKLVKMLALLAGLLHITLFIFVCVSRLSYRYELEWLEGASLIQVDRIVKGLPLYSPPTIENISLIYTPVYFYAAALLSTVTGLSFTPLRLVSFFSSIGIGLIIFLTVREKTSSNLSGILGAGLFAAGFGVTGGWYDIARTDMLSVFFVFTAFYFLQQNRKGTTFLSGLLFALAVLTKQTTLPFPLFALAYIFFTERNLFTALLLSFFGSLAIGVGLLVFKYGNWFFYYTITLPSTHMVELSLDRIFSGIQGLFIYLFIVIIILLGWFAMDYKDIFANPIKRYYWAIAVVASAVSMLAYLNRGGYLNVITPAISSYAILLGIGIDTFTRKLSATKIEPVLARYFSYLPWILCFTQFVILTYIPTGQIPTAEDAQAGDMLVNRISSISGNVFIPEQNYLALYAGKEPMFHNIAMLEIKGDFSREALPEWEKLKSELNRSIEEGEFAAIILSTPDTEFNLKANCSHEEFIEYESREVFFPIAGNNFRPTVIYTDCHKNSR